MMLLNALYPNILTTKDFFIPLIILGIIFFVAQRSRRKYSHTTAKRFFYPALVLRLIGCLLSALMYQFYYDAGDTFGYYQGAATMCDVFWKENTLFWDLFWSHPDNLSFEAFNHFRETRTEWYASNPSTFMVIKIGSILGILTFKSYLAMGFLLSYFSFVGCWKLFEVFRGLYPHLEKKIAIATLFIPSIFFWGAAGLTKDTIVMACLGYLIWGIYFLFLKGKYIFRSIIFISLGFYWTFVLKIYVAAALIPAVMIWIFLVYDSRIKSKLLKVLAKPLFLLISGLIAIFLVEKIASYSEQYALDKVADYAKAVQTYHKDVTERVGGSGYELGEYEMTPKGVLSMVPKSINVTLFRPYIWETRKPILLPSVLESLITLFFTIYVFFTVGIWKTLKALFKDPNVLFCLSFALIFAFAVGFSTYNFGALARYKIPALPFYFIALFVLLDANKKNRPLHSLKPNL